VVAERVGFTATLRGGFGRQGASTVARCPIADRLSRVEVARTLGRPLGKVCADRVAISRFREGLLQR